MEIKKNKMDLDNTFLSLWDAAKDVPGNKSYSKLQWSQFRSFLGALIRNNDRVLSMTDIVIGSFELFEEHKPDDIWIDQDLSDRDIKLIVSLRLQLLKEATPFEKRFSWEPIETFLKNKLKVI